MPYQRLAIANYAAKFGALVHQILPYVGKEAEVNPALEGEMNRAIISEVFREVVPLYATTQAIDDGIEGGTLVNPLTSGGLR